MHTKEFYRLGSVYFNNYLLSLLYVGCAVTKRSSRNDITFLGDHASLNDSNIKGTTVDHASTGQLTNFAKMEILILNFVCIDGVTHSAIGLIGHAEVNTVNVGQNFIELWAYGSTSPKVNLERLLLHALSKSNRNCFRITGRGESGRTNVHVRPDVKSCFFSSSDLAAQFSVKYAISDINH